MTITDPDKKIGRVGDWSAEKLDLLRCYLGGNGQKGGFVPATQKASHRYYIDLFAGPGQNQVRGTGTIIDGSPLIALKAGPPQFTRLFLCDADPQNTRSLDAHRRDYPGRQVTIMTGDANSKVKDVLRLLPREFPVLAFLDPRGGELSWQTIVQLAQHKAPNRPKIELFILFAYNQGLVRFMPYDPAKMVNEDILDRVMPDPVGWRRVYAMRSRIDRYMFRREMLDVYVKGLKSLGYACVPPPRLICMPNGKPLYFMIFASDHEAGDAIMNWCLCNVRDSLTQGSLLNYSDRY